MKNGKNNGKLKMVPSKSSPSLGENDGKFISTGNFGNTPILNSCKLSLSSSDRGGYHEENRLACSRWFDPTDQPGLRDSISVARFRNQSGFQAGI